MTKKLVVHPNAALFESPEDPTYFLAPDLGDPCLTWTWKNEPGGWLNRQKSQQTPKDFCAKALPAEHGQHSGWEGCRPLTLEESTAHKEAKIAARKAERLENAAVRASARPAHRPVIEYGEKIANVHLRVKNKDILAWSNAAARDGLVFEDWLIALGREYAKSDYVSKKDDGTKNE